MKINPLLAPLLLSLSLTACDPVLSSGGSDLTQPTLSDAASSAQPGSSEVRLNPVSLIGVVRARSTQALISNATVRINTQAAQSDAAGFYQLDGLPLGEVKLIVMAQGYQAFTKTLTLKAGSQVEDIDLAVLGDLQPIPQPGASASPDSGAPLQPSPQPSASASGILILLPDGTASAAPTPIPTPTAVPTPSPVPSSDPSASPSPEPAYDPILDEAVNAQILVSRQNENLRLTFTLNQANGLPVNWDKGTVQIEYHLANGDGSPLTNGTSKITVNGDSFVVPLGSREAENTVNYDITLILPNLSQIKKKGTQSDI